MVGDDAPQGSGYSIGLELREVFFILVETKEVRIGQIRFHTCINTSIENSSEKEPQSFVVVDGGVVLVGEADEDVKGVHKEAIGFVPILLTNEISNIS